MSSNGTQARAAGAPIATGTEARSAVDLSAVNSASFTPPAVNPWVIALTVTLATFMEVLDTSVANVALPHIAGSLSAGQDESTWVLTSYLVSNAIVLPMSGWFSSLIGRKRFYMSCVALFTISSCFCGLAPSLSSLIFFRVLQGVGGGGLQPSEQAILADTFSPRQRGMAFAVYGMAVVFAPAIGPTLGGWITDNFSWRWIFFINIPVGIVSLLLTQRLISDPPYMKQQKRSGIKIDYVGFSLLALGLGTLQVVLDKGQRDDWFGSHFIVTMSIVSAVAIVAVLIWEWRHKHPIVNLHLFRDRSFAVGTLLMFMVGFALMSSTVLIPLYLQTIMGYTAQQAGLALMPGGFAIIIIMPFVGFMLGKVDARRLLLVGFSVLSIAMFHMALTFDTTIDFRTAATARAFQAVSLAFLFVPINTASYAFLPKEKNNAASGLINLARNIGGSVGISVVTTMLDRRAQVHQTYLVHNMSQGSGRMRGMLASMQHMLIARGSSAWEASRRAYGMMAGLLGQQATVMAYLDCFFLLAVAALIMLPFVFLMKKVKPGGPIAVH